MFNGWQAKFEWKKLDPNPRSFVFDLFTLKGHSTYSNIIATTGDPRTNEGMDYNVKK